MRLLTFVVEFSSSRLPVQYEKSEVKCNETRTEISSETRQKDALNMKFDQTCLGNCAQSSDRLVE